MQKGKMVQDVLGRRLEPYGFAYDGYRDRRWSLKRVTENNVEHYVVVYKSAYDTSLRLELSTSVQGDYLADSPSLVRQFISYFNDDDFSDILERYGDYVIEHGLSILDRMSVPLYLFEPDEHMYAELYKNNDELARSFMEKNNIDSSIALESSFGTIESIIIGHEGERKFDVCEKLVLLEITAFFGNKVISTYNGSWEWDNEYNNCSINYIKGKKNQWDFLLPIVRAWEKSEIDSIKNFYKYIRNIW